MSARFVAPYPYGLRDEGLSLSRASSQHHALINTKSAPNPVTSESAMGSPANTSAPIKSDAQRRHFVFTDPVAFRFVLTKPPSQIQLTSS
jgi:hypothetical protein